MKNLCNKEYDFKQYTHDFCSKGIEVHIVTFITFSVQIIFNCKTH